MYIRPRMMRVAWVFLGAGVLCAGMTASTALGNTAAQRASTSRAMRPRPVSSHATATPAIDHAGHNAVLRKYCVTCHNDKSKTGGLSLASFDVARAANDAETAEKMIRKLQAGMMPPPGVLRPDPATYAAVLSALETTVDVAARVAPNPGRRTFQRLNRAEYARAIRDLLALDVNAGDWLPLDRMSANFDNIADEQALSPTLLEAYLNAASAISRMAVGDRGAAPIDHTYTNPSYVSQHPWDHVAGAPYGTRGGMVVSMHSPPMPSTPSR